MMNQSRQSLFGGLKNKSLACTLTYRSGERCEPTPEAEAAIDHMEGSHIHILGQVEGVLGRRVVVKTVGTLTMQLLQ